MNRVERIGLKICTPLDIGVSDGRAEYGDATRLSRPREVLRTARVTTVTRNLTHFGRADQSHNDGVVSPLVAGYANVLDRRRKYEYRENRYRSKSRTLKDDCYSRSITVLPLER